MPTYSSSQKDPSGSDKKVSSVINNPLSGNVTQVMSSAHYIQAKLEIGSPDDPLEREADQMADKVMRMPESNLIQRKCTDCDEKEKINRKPLSSEITPFIQRKSSSNSVANSAVTNQINASLGKGSPLSSGTKGFMGKSVWS